MDEIKRTELKTSEIKDIKEMIKPGTVVYVPMKVNRVNITYDDQFNILYRLSFASNNSGLVSINHDDLMNIMMKDPVSTTTVINVIQNFEGIEGDVDKIELVNQIIHLTTIDEKGVL